MTERVTITLPDDLVAEIDAFASASGRSRSSVIREASAAWVTRAKAAAEATRRSAAVAETLSFLDGLGELPVADERSVGHILREIRGPLGEPHGGASDAAATDTTDGGVSER